MQVTGTGTTALRLKVWSGATEPTDWTLTATDTTAALQSAGGIGLGTYLSGSSTNAPIVFSFDNLALSQA
ncbi:hypothetical protein G7085_05190 [Tessaracoccus sp. HDW20]|uniref:hypothetical protein n=1 Tax=Tessaracoccus coleopterorum TaxID=2714950 RepID=UPI0018D4444A|nr:hypothetical protein [Tessaracoccus coleopterorum]NHB84225.1 hypothetical protein [Tessaracoccus coleopterorum]